MMENKIIRTFNNIVELGISDLIEEEIREYIKSLIIGFDKDGQAV